MSAAVPPPGFAHCRTKRTARGFTLIELLVVVSIIALLIAILLPSLRNARALAKRAGCGANLAQIGHAFHMYTDDHRGRLLKGVNAQLNFGGQQGAGDPAYGNRVLPPAPPVPKPLNPYVQLPEVAGLIEEGVGVEAVRHDRSAALFSCAGDEGFGIVRPSNYHHIGTSYIANLFVVGPEQLAILSSDPCRVPLQELARRLPRMTISQIDADASRLILFADYGLWEEVQFNQTPIAPWHQKPGWFNLVFLDGHVGYARVRKGLHVGENYSTIPCRDLEQQVAALQPNP